MQTKKKSKEKQIGKKILILVVLLMLFCIIGWILMHILLKKIHQETMQNNGWRGDAGIHQNFDTASTFLQESQQDKSIEQKAPRQSSIIATMTQDSKNGKSDSVLGRSRPLSTDSLLERNVCKSDTSAPWVWAEPAGGLHRNPVDVAIKSDDLCRIEYRFGEDAWTPYPAGTLFTLSRDSVLWFRGTDSCGNESDIRSESYVFAASLKKECPDNMELVDIGETKFCVDRYEWPNRKGQKPLSFVSVFGAMDSCFAAKKRLCTTEEWRLACGGPYSWEYTYGDAYESRACNTRDTTVRASGSFPECRGYLGVYDMSGNLAEWTSTKSAKNSAYYNVMGGYWESGTQSTCGGARYSYYPQNKHNPVGFRCCASIELPEEKHK
jgi:hypothetical protein